MTGIENGNPSEKRPFPSQPPSVVNAAPPASVVVTKVRRNSARWNRGCDVMRRHRDGASAGSTFPATSGRGWSVRLSARGPGFPELEEELRQGTAERAGRRFHRPIVLLGHGGAGAVGI